MNKIAITGAFGFIGSYLTKRLVADGFKVVAIDNFLRGSKERLSGFKDKIDLVDLDIRNTSLLETTLTGCHTVFHLAAVNGTENFYKYPDLVLDVGIKGMFSIAEASVKAKVKNLIVASSAEVYQTPEMIPTREDVPLVIPNSINPRYSYGISKIATESIALNFNNDKFEKVQIFRPHNVYGPDMGWKHVIPQLLMQLLGRQHSRDFTYLLKIQGDGSETRAFCYVDDIVEGILKMQKNGKNREIYHIGSDYEVSILELINEIKEIMNIEIKIDFSSPVIGGTSRRCPDISKIRKIGYSPCVSLREGLSRTIKWYANHQKNLSLNELQ